MIRGLTKCLVAVALFAAIPFTERAHAQAFDVSLTVFHDGLAAHGEWRTSARFGDVWVPRGVLSSWRPYTVGYWTYTDVGWTWVSDEPWGWATYHYGRWYFDDGYGWAWAPDTVWGPSWVAWRSNADYVGWAPLPPGVAVTAQFDPVLDPFAFTFVRTRYLVDRQVFRYIEPPARSVTFVRLTSNATRFTMGGAIAINTGVRIDLVERAVGHPVPRLTIQATNTAGAVRVEGNHLVLYRPTTVVVARNAAEARRPLPAPARLESASAMAARQAREQKDLAAEQARARAALEAKHAEELRTPPAGVSLAEVRARQEAEHQAQTAAEARQKQVLDAQHARERNGGRGGGR